MKKGKMHFSASVIIFLVILSTIAVINTSSSTVSAKDVKEPSINNDFQFTPKEEMESCVSDFHPFFFDRKNRYANEEYKSSLIFDGDSIEIVVGVNYTNPQAYEGIVGIIEKWQGTIVNTVSTNDGILALVADIPFTLASKFMKEIYASGLARYVEPNRRFRAAFTPNDQYWNYQWGPQKIEADWAWNSTTGNHSILVAVIDTGIDYTHPDLADNYVPLGYDWVNDDNDPLDDNGHGTHCAGIIAAIINNTVGIAGVANVSIMAEKGLDLYGYGTEDDLAEAIIHAVDAGANILSNSWGDYVDSHLIHDAIKYAYNHDVLIIAAAGNDAWDMKLYPAAYDEVIAVTATDSYDYPATFTNFGEWVEVAAPGVSIYSTMPTYHVTLNDYGYSMNYDYLSGTSMACPHVAGVAALIWSQFSDASRDWVRVQLRRTAEDLGELGFDEYYGYGRVNARQAVEQAPPEHDLLIYSWSGSLHIPPEETALFNLTIMNFGQNNEEDVTVQFFINGSLINSTLIDYIPAKTTLTLNFSWTPMTTGIYNVTFYIQPVLDEAFLENNVLTLFISVHYPLINPEEGQYANYIINYYDASGTLIGYGYWNFTYANYVEPYKMNVTISLRSPDGYEYFEWLVVNTMTRLVEQGIWTGFWYPAWIETDIEIGSTINLLDGIATVNDSRIIILPSGRAIDCWEVFHMMYGTFWYDKGTGLWISMETTDIYSGYTIELMLIDTNIPIGTNYQHDLGVSLEVPARIPPGESTTINATVFNLGLNNETDVEIHLLINGTEVKSETLSELVNGTWYTLKYSWTPMTEGIYNITAYTPIRTYENDTENNIDVEMVHVRLIEVALISDYSELTVVAPILDSMGIGCDIYNSNYYNRYTENLDLLLNYRAIIFYNSYRQISTTEYTTLETYLSLGGNLLVTGFDCLVSDTLLASLVRSSSIGDNVGEPDLIVVEESHPIMNGPYGSFPQGYHIYDLFFDCDMAEADTSRGAITVAELLDGYDRIIATEVLPGKIVFWNGDGTYDWTGNSDCQVMFKNTIHWFLKRYEHDLVVSLEVPKFLEPGDSAIINATVTNQGLNNETDVEIQLLINGTLVESAANLELLTGESYTIEYSWSPSTVGFYNITVYAPPVPNENVTTNNVFSRIVSVRYAPKILAYVEYADYYYDYANTLSAIQSIYGPYELTELWDYRQLNSMIAGKDILLIPDQELGSFSLMEMIGESWAETLSEFIENGGIVILCDGVYGYGGTYGMLTGAQLMTITGTNYRSYYTLYLTDPTDPLAKGVSPTFYGPYYTVSFVTQETNVVVDDGTYPVVIHKTMGRGHVILLGFDFEYYNLDTQKLLGNAVSFANYISILVTPSAGAPGTKVTIRGIRATANSTVSIYWDNQFIGNVTADEKGCFEYILNVPSNAAIGLHQVTALDVATGRVGSADFRVIVIALNPNMGGIGTKVSVTGRGFMPETEITITFNDMLIGYSRSDSLGNFTFEFTIPLSTAGTHTIKAWDSERNCIYANFTVIDFSSLDVDVKVGTLHFAGEIAEFYLQTTFKGQAVNATMINAMLYGPNGEIVHYQYPENISIIATGLYKIVYIVPSDADTGTYTLVVTATYNTEIIQANGTSFNCFSISQTLSQTLSNMNADIEEIKEAMEAMNVTLEEIFEKIIAINGTTVIIQTKLGAMEGTMTDVGTIVVPGIGEIKTDLSELQEAQQNISLLQYVILALAVIAVAASTISMIFARRGKYQNKS